MAGHREVLTFQLGNYTNYVCTHWWNIQESYFSYDEKNPSEICHDVLFREGKTFKEEETSQITLNCVRQSWNSLNALHMMESGPVESNKHFRYILLKGVPTFTARTIVVDKKENARHTSVLDDNLVASKRNTTVVWDPGRVSEEFINAPEKHEYIQDLEKIERGQRVSKKDYNFDETVRTWPDYMRTRYHPRSLALINSDSKTDIFHSGTEMYDGIEEDLTEKIRCYMEECNNLQGFQLLADAVDAFGGLASHVVTHLRDEYPNKTIFILPLIPSFYATANQLDSVYKTINLLLCYQKLSEFCDLVVPLCTSSTAWRGLGSPINFPHLTYDPRIFYQSSSILAAYLDSVSLKYRLKGDIVTLQDIASGLNFWNRKICAASMSLPFPIPEHSYLLETLENYDESVPLWNCLTPSCTIGNERIFYQRITLRGITSERLKDPTATRRNSQAYTCTSVSELLHLYLSFHLNTISDVTSAKTPLKTETPFPRIFNRRVSRVGSLSENVLRKDKEEVLSCPVLAGLHSCKDIGRMLESLHLSVKGINIRRFHQFLGTGMDLDEYKECLEKVLLLGNEYVSDMEI